MLNRFYGIVDIMGMVCFIVFCCMLLVLGFVDSFGLGYASHLLIGSSMVVCGLACLCEFIATLILCTRLLRM